MLSHQGRWCSEWRKPMITHLRVETNSMPDQGKLILNGFWAHCYPVEHVAVRENFVASAAQREINIWHWNIDSASCLPRTHTALTSSSSTAALACLARAIVPPSKQEANVRAQCADAGDETHPKNFEVLVTGTFWTQTSLIVAFLYHGIRYLTHNILLCLRVGLHTS